jgi:hypothetical protein
VTKSKEWACSDPTCVVDTSREICPHLEALLPSMRDKKLQRVDMGNMSLDVFQVMRPTFSLERFQELMRNYGFIDEWDMELLTLKYFHGMSNRQITKDQNYCSPRTTDRRLKQLHAQLVERGFSQELE